MALSLRARKRWAIFILVVGLPLYIVAAISLVSLLERPSIWVELLIYIGLGIAWMLPLRRIFLGVGRGDQTEETETK